MTRPEPVCFRNPGGRELFGMLHRVEDRRNETGIVLLSPGIKNRIAPHRLYVKMARRFEQLGFECLRFDPECLGDSDGEIEERYTADVYGLIQVGRFVEDTRAALDWMERERGIRRFIVGGLCGGAITGLLEGQDDPRVVGLLGLGIPVILDGSSIDKRQFMTSGQLDTWRAGYYRRLAEPGAWLRLLTLRTDFKVLFKTLVEPLRKVLGLRRAKAAGDATDDLNPCFPPAFEKFASAGKKMLLIFSGADRLQWEYEEKFVSRYPEIVSRARPVCELHVVENANHIFSLEEWQREMLDLSSAWLSAHFGAGDASPRYRDPGTAVE